MSEFEATNVFKICLPGKYNRMFFDRLKSESLKLQSKGTQLQDLLFVFWRF